jgi:hypothetical protein
LDGSFELQKAVHSSYPERPWKAGVQYALSLFRFLRNRQIFQANEKMAVNLIPTEQKPLHPRLWQKEMGD